MQRDIAEVEQRMLNILKRNSRATITEISKSLGISRVTAKKVLNSLVQNGRIRKFTILLDEEEKELAMVQVDQIENIPASLILEDSKFFSQYKGKTYYFCSGHCKEEFDKTSLKYTR